MRSISAVGLSCGCVENAVWESLGGLGGQGLFTACRKGARVSADASTILMQLVLGALVQGTAVAANGESNGIVNARRH